MHPQSEAEVTRIYPRYRDPDARREYMRRYYHANKARIRVHQKKWEGANPEKLRAKAKRYRDANEDKVLAARRLSEQRRRERLAAAGPADALSAEYAAVLQLDVCGYCGERVPIQIDHIEPIARGGSGVWDNLTAACLRCNASKNARPLLTFLLARA